MLLIRENEKKAVLSVIFTLMSLLPSHIMLSIAKKKKKNLNKSASTASIMRRNTHRDRFKFKLVAVANTIISPLHDCQWIIVAMQKEQG